MKKLFALSSLFGLLLIAACSSSDSDKKDDPDVAKTPKPICPQVAIVRDLENVVDYGAEQPDPSQFVAQAHMKAIEGDCAYFKDGIDIRFSVDFVAARGPRLGGLHFSFPYFIAIADPSGKILSKDRMTKEFGFSSSSKITNDSEDLHVVIPLSKSKWATGPDYQVLLGFQLTKEQLDAVRSNQAPAKEVP